MTTISDGTTTITPLLVTGWDTSRDTQNVVHVIVGRADADITYRAAGLRAGQLVVLCATLEAALQVEALAAQAKKLTLADVDHPSINMSFVANGRIRVELHDETREQATVSIDFLQVAP